MKRRLGKFLLAALFAVLIFLIVGILIKKAKAEEVIDKINKLPNLVLTDIIGNSFRTDKIESGPLLITFFHPECDHCRYEISSLLGSGLLDNDLTVLFVSSADKSEIQSFMCEIGMDGMSNLHVFHDPDFKISDLFRADIMPTNYLYSDSLYLVKVLKGSTRPETILKYLNAND